MLILLIGIGACRAQSPLIQPLSAVSRLRHGDAGTFDIPLPLAAPTPGIECRTGNPANSYQIVVTFARPIRFNSPQLTTVLGGTLAGIGGSGTSVVTVNLSGVTNGQTIMIRLLGVTDGHSASDISIPMSVLVGDTRGNGVVNSSDVSQTSAQNGSSITAANFRTDVNANGAINATDVALVKGQVGMSLSYTRFSFTLDSKYQTSAGVYKPDGTLIRTLWRKVLYRPGTTVRSWDGNDDSGVSAGPGSYEIRLLYHNVQYIWDGVIGNSSSEMSGLTPHRGSTFMESLAIDGPNAFYAIGECEGFFPVSEFTTVTPQSRTTVLAPDGLTGFDLVATDGINVYISNGGSTGEQGRPKGYTTFVIAHNVSDNTNYTFANGKQIIVNGNGPSTYDSCIDTDYYTPPVPTPPPDTRLNPKRPTGLAVQKNGNILAVSHGGLNTIRLFDKSSGALLTHNITVTSPQGLAMDSKGDLWVITGTSLQRYSNLSTSPTLLRTITGFSAPIAVAVHPSNPEIVLVADGGDAQIIKAFDRSGQQLWTYGQPGGYSTNGPDVADTKFEFQVSTKSDPIYRIALAVQSDGSFWIGDGATSRLLHINPSHTASIPADTIMFLPHNGPTAADPNNPTRVIGDNWLEFQVDYSQPIQQGWILKKNWAAGLSSRYFGFGEGLLNVTTLNNGRVYAMMHDFAVDKNVLIELPSMNSPPRICKTDTNSDLFIERVPAAIGLGYDNALRKPSFEADGSLRYNQFSAGPIVSWYKKPLVSFDANGNPQWGDAALIASAPHDNKDPTTLGETGWQTLSVPITSSNIIVALDGGHHKYPIPACGPGCTIACDGWHLGGITVNSNQWQWRSSPGVTSEVPMDGLGSFDIGDGVNYPATIPMALGRNVFYDYNGELWNQTEASQLMHFYDDGLFVGQFGTQGIYKKPTGYILPGFAGGGSHYPSVVGVGANSEAYLWANDQSHHSAVIRWHIVGTNTIREQSGIVSIGGTVTLAGSAAAFPTAVSAVPGDGQVVLSWIAAAGATSYDVKRSTVNGGSYSTVLTTSNTTATVSGLTNGTGYYFVVSVHESTANSNQVQSFPFEVVGIAGQIKGGPQWSADYDPPFVVNSAAPLIAQPALVGLDNVLGNVTRTNVGTKGYVIYNWEGGGPDNGSTPVPFTVNSNLLAPFSVTVESGWYNQAHRASSRCLIDGVLGSDSSLNLHSNISGSIDINVSDTAMHYLSVFCPTVDAGYAGGSSFTIKLTPLGQTSPAASYPVHEARLEAQNHVFQFVFIGSVTLTIVNENADEGACLQALFLD